MADILAGAIDQAKDAAESLTGGSFKVGVSPPLIATFIVWVILGVVLGYFLTDNRIVYSAFVFVGWSFCVLLHEMGHAAFAFWAGDATVKDYTCGNFIEWESVINNYVVPVCASGVFGIGINGGITWLSEARMAFAGDKWRVITAFGGLIFSLSFNIILAIPLFILNDHVTWVYCGLAVLIYLNFFSSILNLVPILPMDMFNVIFPFLPDTIQAYANKFTSNKWYCLAILIVIAIIAWLLSSTIGSAAGSLCSLLGVKNAAYSGLSGLYVLLN